MDKQGGSAIAVSGAQVENMLHCIGYTPRRAKRGKYTAFRNYFTTSGPDSELDDLVDKGLAESRVFPGCVGLSAGRVYHVTRKGMDFLEVCLGGVKIKEGD